MKKPGRQTRRALADIFGERVSFSREDRLAHARDAALVERLPAAVAWPENTQQVLRAVLLANQAGFPITARGAGSSLTGGAAPLAGGLVLSFSRMDRILSIDAANRVGVAEPGVITARFQAAAEAVGLFYPPDPASREFSTLGGNAAENAGGTRALKYGVTRDWVLGLTAITGAGELIHTGVATHKGVAGYDLTRLIVGSEGTLALITRLTLKLMPKPEAVATLAAYFTDIDQAAGAVAAIVAARLLPSTLEFMDQASLAVVQDYAALSLPPEAGAMLLIEADGSPGEAARQIEHIRDLLTGRGALGVQAATDPAQAEALWRARRAISPALHHLAHGKLNEDIVVPPASIPAMVRAIEQVAAKRDLAIPCFGHAGDGNIHVNVMYNPADQAETDAAHLAVEEIFALTLKMGGTISGEHGIGLAKAAFMGLEFSPVELAVMARVKAAFDPRGVLNPDKIFGARP